MRRAILCWFGHKWSKSTYLDGRFEHTCRRGCGAVRCCCGDCGYSWVEHR